MPSPGTHIMSIHTYIQTYINTYIHTGKTFIHIKLKCLEKVIQHDHISLIPEMQKYFNIYMSINKTHT